MTLGSNIMGISSIYPTNIARKTITCSSFWRIKFRIFFVPSWRVIPISMPHIDCGKEHCKNRDNGNERTIKDKGEAHIQQDQRMRTDKNKNPSVQKALFKSVIFFPLYFMLRKIFRGFVRRFLSLQNFIKQNVQGNRNGDVSVNNEQPIKIISANKSKDCRKNPVGCLKQQLRIISSKVILIFSKKYFHNNHVLFSVTIPFLNYATKSKTLLFTKYFILLPIGLTASSFSSSGNLKISKEKLRSHFIYPHLYHQILGTTERFY